MIICRKKCRKKINLIFFNKPSTNFEEKNIIYFIEIISKTDIIYLVDLIKQLWEYNSSNISKVIAP